MSTRLLAILLAVVALLLGAIAWVVDERTGEKGASLEPTTHPVREAGASSGEILAPARNPEVDHARRREASPSIDSARIEPSAETDLPLHIVRGLHGDAPLVLVRGRVIDPSGHPVLGAAVHFRNGEGHLKTGMTDARGTFAVNPSPGELELCASDSRFAESATLALVVAAGEERDGVELVLRLGGTLEGEVRDTGGRGIVGGQLRVRGLDVDVREREFLTDAAGRFSVRALPPGDYEIRLGMSAEDARALLGPGKEGSVPTFSSYARIVGGETTRVTLNWPDLEWVRVSGRVQAGTKPIADALVTFSDRERSDSTSSCRTSLRGRYALVLAGAGSYDISLLQAGGVVYRTEAEIPRVPSFELDLTFEVGTIAGRIRGPGGEAIAWISVEARAEGAAGPLPVGRATADDQGFYALSVPPGTYALQAGGAGAASARFGRSRVEGIVVASGARVDGVDLDLQRGGALEGIVRLADGAAAEETYLQVLDARGLQIADGFSGADGRFRIESVLPGTCTLHATSRLPSTIASVEIHVSAGENPPVELVLR